jgi:hypothetical protein
VTADQGTAVTENGTGFATRSGIRLEEGVLVLDGSADPVAVSKNGRHGLHVAARQGAAALSASAQAVVFAENGLDGARVDLTLAAAAGADWSVGASGSSFERNAGWGAEVLNTAADGHGIKVAFGTSAFKDNASGGILVQSSAPLAGGERSLSITQSTFSGGAMGVVLGPAVLGSASQVVTGTISGNTIQGAQSPGLTVNGTAGCALTVFDNTISGNNAGGGIAVGGGVVLTGVQPGAGWSFTRNRVRRNGGSQIVVGVPSGSKTAWKIGPASGCEDANQMCGYNAAAGSYGLLAVNADVDATLSSWVSVDPVAGVDYFGAPPATVIAVPDCGDGIPVCPAP